MKTKQKKSFLAKIPSAILALFVLILAVIALIITDSIYTPRAETGPVSLIVNALIITLGCYFIIRANPKSIWYVPLICNAVEILSSIVEPHFWQSSMLIYICGGWALSLLVSLIAAQQGKRTKRII